MKKIFGIFGIMASLVMFISCSEDPSNDTYRCKGKITITNNKSNDYVVTISADKGSFSTEFELKEGYFHEIKNLDAGTYSIIAKKQGAVFEGLTTKTTSITLACDESRMWIID